MRRLLVASAGFLMVARVLTASDGNEEEAAVKVIQQHKGYVGFDTEGGRKIYRVLRVNCRAEADALAVVKQAKHLKDVDRVWYSFNAADTTDEHLAHLSAIPNLKELTLSGKMVTDKGIKIVTAHRGLEDFRVGGDEITAEGIKQLAQLQNLRVLGVIAPKATPEAYAALADLPKLEKLVLRVF